MIYEPHIECASQRHLLAVQATRLRNYLNTVPSCFSEYRKILAKARLDGRLYALTDEELLARFYSAGFTDSRTYVAIDARALRRIDRKLFYLETTSGTTSAPKARYATIEDELIDIRMAARSLAAFEISPKDRVLTVDLGEMNFYALMTKALAELGVYNSLFYSARKPFSCSMKEALAYKPDVLITIPGILMRSYAGFVESMKAAPSVKKLVYYAEPLDKKIQEHLLREFGIQSFSLYSSIELGMIGAECIVHDGIHIWADCLLPALKNAKPVKKRVFRKQGNRALQGSLGMTTLMHTGKPTLAYLSGDEVQYTDVRCGCGRTLPRINFVERESDAFSVYGAKFTYQQIHDVVYKHAEVTNFLQIVLEDDDNGTLMKLILPKQRQNTVKQRQTILSHDLRTHVGLSFMVDHGVLRFDFEFQPAEHFTSRKIRKVVDRRG